MFAVLGDFFTAEGRLGRVDTDRRHSPVDTDRRSPLHFHNFRGERRIMILKRLPWDSNLEGGASDCYTAG